MRPTLPLCLRGNPFTDDQQPLLVKARELEQEAATLLEPKLFMNLQDIPAPHGLRLNQHPGDPLTEGWWPDPCMRVGPKAGVDVAKALTCKVSLLKARQEVFLAVKGEAPGYKSAIRMAQDELA